MVVRIAVAAVLIQLCACSSGPTVFSPSNITGGGANGGAGGTAAGGGTSGSSGSSSGTTGSSSATGSSSGSGGSAGGGGFGFLTGADFQARSVGYRTVTAGSNQDVLITAAEQPVTCAQLAGGAPTAATGRLFHLALHGPAPINPPGTYAFADGGAQLFEDVIAPDGGFARTPQASQGQVQLNSGGVGTRSIQGSYSVISSINGDFDASLCP
jgi:hypothetical protein